MVQEVDGAVEVEIVGFGLRGGGAFLVLECGTGSVPAPILEYAGGGGPVAVIFVDVDGAEKVAARGMGWRDGGETVAVELRGRRTSRLFMRGDDVDGGVAFLCGSASRGSAVKLAFEELCRRIASCPTYVERTDERELESKLVDRSVQEIFIKIEIQHANLTHPCSSHQSLSPLFDATRGHKRSNSRRRGRMRSMSRGKCI